MTVPTRLPTGGVYEGYAGVGLKIVRRMPRGESKQAQASLADENLEVVAGLSHHKPDDESSHPLADLKPSEG